MSKKTRSVLKSYFNVGDQPTEDQFIDVFDSTLNLSEDNAITGSLTISGSAVNLLVQGDITASGYTLDGVALTTTFTELNYLDGLTSFEATQIKNINSNAISDTEWSYVAGGQAHATTSTPTFAGLTLTKLDFGTLNLGVATSIALEEGLSGQLVVRAVPSILAGASSATYTLTGDMIRATSVIMISTKANITCNVTTIAAGSCNITFHNPTNTAFTGTDVTINIVII